MWLQDKFTLRCLIYVMISNKLERYGVRGLPPNLLTMYLVNYQQYTMLNGLSPNLTWLMDSQQNLVQT